MPAAVEELVVVAVRVIVPVTLPNIVPVLEEEDVGSPDVVCVAIGRRCFLRLKAIGPSLSVPCAVLYSLFRYRMRSP